MVVQILSGNSHTFTVESATLHEEHADILSHFKELLGRNLCFWCVI